MKASGWNLLGLLLVTFFTGRAWAEPSVTLEARRPNIIFVLTDDQGYGDLSCHGNPILKTPNLDRLHDEGVRFTDERDNAARVWPVIDGKLWTPVSTLRPAEAILQHPGGIGPVVFSPDGRTVLAGGGQSALWWESPVLKPANVAMWHRRAVFAMAFSPDGRTGTPQCCVAISRE